jgi:hypothetical protein
MKRWNLEFRREGFAAEQARIAGPLVRWHSKTRVILNHAGGRTQKHRTTPLAAPADLGHMCAQLGNHLNRAIATATPTIGINTVVTKMGP